MKRPALFVLLAPVVGLFQQAAAAKTGAQTCAAHDAAKDRFESAARVFMAEGLYSDAFDHGFSELRTIVGAEWRKLMITAD